MEHFKPPSPLKLEGNVAENWRIWKQKYRNYVTAIDMEEMSEARQLAILLHVVGDDALEVYNTFTFTAEERNKVEPVLERFEAYCNPRKNLTYERHKFFTRNQLSGESFDQFVTELRTKAATCEFGDLRESLIKDRIVCGIADDSLKERLLRVADLDLKKATDICRAAEYSKSQIKSIKDEREIDMTMRRTNNAAATRTKYQSTAKPEDAVTRKAVSGQNFSCKRCGRAHGPRECPAYGKCCKSCGNKNHFAKMCRTRKKVNLLDSQQHESSEDEFFIGEVGAKEASDEDWKATIELNRENIQFKIDTGAQANILPERVYNQMKSPSTLKNTNVKLTTYDGTKLNVIGVTSMKCKYKDAEITSDFYVIPSTSQPALLGLKTSTDLNLIKLVRSIDASESLLDEYSDVFEGLGDLGEHHIEVDPTVKPVVNPPRKVPFTLLPQLKKELERMESLGVIEKVDIPTDWVNSIVPVEKENGSIRICLDPRNLNKAVKREHFQLPTASDVTSKLSGASLFSKLDAKDGFWHVTLDYESSLLTTFGTPFGRYKFNRLPFGLKSANEVFQKKMQQAFEGIPGAEVIYDDILIYAKDSESHDQALRQVMDRARERKVKLNKAKSQLKIPEVTYLGEKISADGVRPSEAKVAAIVNMPAPQNRKDVERLLGMITYLSKYIPNMSTVTEPLRVLLRNDTAWHWEDAQVRSLEEIKRIITSEPVLQYYDVEKPVRLSVDASQSGLGAVILHPDGPIAYASRSLNDAEKSYPQIDKEALAIVFGCERFHQFLYGKEIKVDTDHKPLEAIFKKPLSSAPPRLQRLLLRLQRYDLNVTYTPGKYMYVADTLSRAYLTMQGDDREPLDELLNAQIHLLTANLPMSQQKCNEFVSATKQDNSLVTLAEYVKKGWPDHRRDLPECIRHYWNFREEIHETVGILFKGNKIIVPESLRQEMLSKIHESHLGVEKSKKRARDIMYWPNMSTQISDMISKCTSCLKYQRKQSKQPLKQHEVPTNPWEKLAADLLTLNGTDYLLTVDYFSKWVEMSLLKDSTVSSEVITALKSMFARHGVPQELFTDNGPQFASRSFSIFAQKWEFKHTTSSPKYPQSNGQVENAVGTLKRMLKKAFEDGTDPYIALLEYRNTPVTGMEYSPAQLLMSRRLRSKLPTTHELLKPAVVPDASAKLKATRSDYKLYFDQHAKPLPDLLPGDAARIHTKGEWLPAVVQGAVKEPRSFLVKTQTGKVLRRNRRDLLKTSEPPPELVNPVDDEPTDIPPRDANDANQPAQTLVRQEQPKVSRYGRSIVPRKSPDYVYY